MINYSCVLGELSIFVCGLGEEIPITQLCDGVKDCNATAGFDETNARCDSEFGNQPTQ